MNKIHSSVSISPTSEVEQGAIIGQDTKIWHWVHISNGAVIGSNCTLGQNVFISSKAKIGNNVKIQNNVSVYDEVVLEDNVFCGPSMVFTNVINPRSFISRKSEYKKTLVKEGASLGANCTIICGITIGKYAFIGAGAVVTKDVKDFSLQVGIPSKQIAWISKYGEKIPLPKHGTGEWICPHSKNIYLLKGDKLIEKDSAFKKDFECI